jgi:hypothetical protein
MLGDVSESLVIRSLSGSQTGLGAPLAPQR